MVLHTEILRRCVLRFKVVWIFDVFASPVELDSISSAGGKLDALHGKLKTSQRLIGVSWAPRRISLESLPLVLELTTN